MHGGTRTIAALLVLLGTAGAFAQTRFEVGDHIRQTHRWDEDGNRFRSGARQGEGAGCWRVTKVARSSISTVLVSGRFKPWWSDEVIPVGSTDEWFDSEIFREANPGSAPLTEIGRTFAVVPSCG